MSEETMGVESTEVSPTTEEVEAPENHGENMLSGVPEVSEEIVDDGSPAIETIETSSDDNAVMLENGRIREELARQKERNEFLEKMAMNNPQAPVVPTQEDPYDPEDFATNASVEELVNKRVRAIEQRNANERIVSQEKSSRSTYSDYDAVAITLTSELIKGNPAKGIPPNRGFADALVAAVQRGENASELAYSFGKTHPEYSQQAITNGVKDVTKKIEKNMSIPQTLSNTSRSQAEKIADDHWNNVSDEELAREGMRRKGLL